MHFAMHSSSFLFFSFLDGSNSEVEKAPFIAKPVRLTPAWEANNLPNDELNFRGIDQHFSHADKNSLLFGRSIEFQFISFQIECFFSVFCKRYDDGTCHIGN